MSELLDPLGILNDDQADVAHTGNASAMSATVVDRRDLPDVNPFARETIDQPSTTRPDRPLVPAAVAPPVPTIPAFGRIVTAQTVTIPAGQAGATRIGLHPSRMQEPRLAYMMVYGAGGSFSIAGDDSAMPASRATFPAGASLTLDHVGGAYVWGDPANPVTLTVLVVGV